MERVRRVVAELQQKQPSNTVQLTLKLSGPVIAQAQWLAERLGVTRTLVMQELLAAAIAEAVEEVESCG
jgi:hypothetical protein